MSTISLADQIADLDSLCWTVLKHLNKNTGKQTYAQIKNGIRKVDTELLESALGVLIGRGLANKEHNLYCLKKKTIKNMVKMGKMGIKEFRLSRKQIDALMAIPEEQDLQKNFTVVKKENPDKDVTLLSIYSLKDRSLVNDYVGYWLTEKGKAIKKILQSK